MAIVQSLGSGAAWLDIISDRGDDVADTWRIISMNNNNLQFLSGASDTRLTIQQDGNVGIGTTSPNTKLDIHGSGSEHLLNITDGASDVMYIKSDGNVGIGTTGPGVKLSVIGPGDGWAATSGTTQTYGISRFGQSGNNAVLDIGVNSDSGAWLQTTNKASLNLAYPLILNPNGGNVGIGTTNPLSKLQVVGNIHLQNDSDKLYFGQAKDVSLNFDGSHFLWTPEVGSPQFRIGGVLNITDTIYID